MISRFLFTLKRRIFTFLCKTKWTIKTINSKFWNLKASSLGSCVSEWQSKARGPNIPKLRYRTNSILLILNSGLLEAERMNKSYDAAKIENIYARLCLYFYTASSLFFLADYWFIQDIKSFWGLLWGKISFPVELQPVWCSRLFSRLLIHPLAVWKWERWT